MVFVLRSVDGCVNFVTRSPRYFATMIGRDSTGINILTFSKICPILIKMLPTLSASLVSFLSPWRPVLPSWRKGSMQRKWKDSSALIDGMYVMLWDWWNFLKVGIGSRDLKSTDIDFSSSISILPTSPGWYWEATYDQYEWPILTSTETECISTKSQIMMFVVANNFLCT